MTVAFPKNTNAQKTDGVRLVGRCPFSPRVLRQALLLESKGKLEVRTEPPFSYRVECSPGSARVISTSETPIRVVELDSLAGAPAARLLALSFVESLGESPDDTSVAPPPAEPELQIKAEADAPALVDETSARPPSSWSLVLGSVLVSASNTERWGGGPTLEIRRTLLSDWRVDAGTSLAWLQDDVPEGRLEELRASAGMAIASPALRLGHFELRGGIGLRIAYSTIEGESEREEFEGGEVDGWSYGPNAKVELGYALTPSNALLFSGELGHSFAEGSALIDALPVELLSGLWIRLGIGWRFDV